MDGGQRDPGNRENKFGIIGCNFQRLKEAWHEICGNTVVYAYLQAVGVIWSHEDECFCRQEDEI